MYTPQDAQDYVFGAPHSAPTVLNHDWDLTGLPHQVDLRAHTGAIENQRGTNACIGKAIASACEVMLSQAGRFLDMSALFVYYNARAKFGQVYDTGTTFKNALSETTKMGVAASPFCPFVESEVNYTPTDAAYNDARNRKITRYERIGAQNANRTIVDTKVALASGYPVLFSMALHQSFLTLSGPMQNHNYTTETMTPWHAQYGGHHAMLCVGYNDATKQFLIENSWGDAWGDGGYTVIDYAAFGANVALNEAFVVREFDGLSYPLLAHFIDRNMSPAVSDADIKNVVDDIMTGPDPYPVKVQSINTLAKQYNVSRPVIARATGYPLDLVNQYLDYLLG